MFRPLYWLAIAGIALVCASGCNSSTADTSTSAQQRMVSPAQDKSLPAPARSLFLQQEQQKRQMDSMRAADAAKAKTP